MKNINLYIFLILLFFVFSNNVPAAVPMKGNGQGNLILTDKILEKLYFYITTRTQNNPLNFFITEDKKNVFSVIRKDTNYKGYSGSGPIARNIKKCESKYKQSCFLFSNQRIIVWNNGINPIDSKKSKLKRKISYDEFITKLNELGFIQTKVQNQITKAKPSQTQKVAKEKSENLYVERILTKQEKLDFAKGKIKIYKCSASTGTHLQKDDCIGDYYKKKLSPKSILNAYLFRDYTKTQIAKAETNVKPEKKDKVVKVEEAKQEEFKSKKKVKVVKVEEPKQEEFKPKKTNQDNEAPVIDITKTITVNNASYEFQGKITDKAKIVFVEVDGRSVEVINGKFTVKGYSPVNKKISIEAIDQWGNRSKPKIVKLIINIKDTNIVNKLEPLNPSKIESLQSNNKVALIIGVEQYDQSPNASFANLDAKYFFDYARKAFGIKKQNIKILVDEEASLSKTYSAIFKWLPGKIKSNETDLIIFFSGHGLASSDGKAKYILPSDADPDLLSKTALSRSELFNQIIELNPKSVIMFFDTCYSGVSRDEETLLASAKPLRIVADVNNEIPDNFTIFTASKAEQISSGLKEAKQGIFSYYLMKGLEGKADANKDKDITNGELLAYMDQNVSDKALILGRQQNPMLLGDPDKILMSYR